MSRTGESIYKRQDGRWEGRYIKDRTPQGKAVYGYVYGRTYSGTKERLHQMAAGISIVPPASPEPIHICMTFGALSENWLRTRHTSVKESTYIKYRNLLQHYILPRLGTIPVMQITVDILNQFYDWLLTKGGGGNRACPPRPRAIRSPLSGVFCAMQDRSGFRSPAPAQRSPCAARTGSYAF